MRISRSFFIPNVDEAIKNKIVNYWQNRHAQFTRITERDYTATRGSLLNNFKTLKMYKLRTSINIMISENNQVTCVLDVNTLFQHVTNWNREYWDLELETFESFLLNDDLKEQEWIEYTKRSRKKDIGLTLLIVVSAGIFSFYFTWNNLQNQNNNSGGGNVRVEQENNANKLGTKSFTNKDGTIQISAPNDWKVDKTLHEQATLGIANLAKEQYLIVLDELKTDFADDATIYDYASIIISGMEQVVVDAVISEPTELVIDGYPALQYYVQGEVDKVKVFYLVTIVDTPEAFNQIIAWTLQSKSDEYKGEFKAITSTFVRLDSNNSSIRNL